MSSLTVRRLVPVVVVGGLLAAVAAAASIATPGIHSVPIVRPNESAADASISAARSSAGFSPQAEPAQAATWHPPTWLNDVFGALCGVIGLAVFGFLVWHLVRMWLDTRAAAVAALEPSATQFASRREAVINAVDISIAELARDDADPRSAVIACWVRLEEVASAAGTPRSAGDTPADLVDRLLRGHQISVRMLTSLAHLYRTARYSPQDIESSMRAEARVALSQLRDELAQSRSGSLEHDPVIEASGSVMAGGHARLPRPSIPQGRPDDAS